MSMFKRIVAFLLLLNLVQANDCIPYLYSTAVVSEPDGVARIECWKFTAPLKTYPTVGAALTLADISNVTYVVLPPRSGEGIHKPPHPMCVEPAIATPFLSTSDGITKRKLS